MCESYARSLLRVSVAQICQALGWDAVQLTACDLLSDVLHRYIQQLARGCHRYSELYGRTDPMLDDVGQAFRLLGVNVSELEDYIHHLEPVEFPHQTPLFPVSKNNMLQFPQPGARDSEERKAYIPEYMPPLVSLQEEEEEEQVLPDMGTSAEAMQVPLDEEEEEDMDMDEDEAVNDENYLAKRRLDSPTSMGVVPAAKRPRLPGFRSPDSPDWGTEPREPLSSLNPQRVPAPVGVPPLHPHDGSGSQATSPGATDHIPASRAQLPTPKIPITPGRKPKVGSPGRQRVKSPKRASSGGLPGSPARSPKASQKEKKKSPGKSKSPKSPKQGLIKAIPPPGKTDLTIKPLLPLSEKVEKENILLKPSDAMVLESEKSPVDPPLRKLELPDNTIEDSIAAVIARACAERKPDPFAFSSGSESEGDGFSSPRRLTISEPTTQKLPGSANSSSTPLPQNVGATLTGNSWTMDDSIDEVLRKVNQGCPSGTPPNPAYISSPSASPPTPEPLLKMYEEKNKLVVSTDIKKKLKKELKSKIKKREKEKQREKERDKGKSKEKSKEKNRDKERELSKEARQPWKDLSSKEDEQRDLLKPRDITESDVPKMKSKDGGGSKKENKHKDKKKDKEKSRKDKEKRDKSKDKTKEDRQKSTASLLLGLKEAPLPLFSPAACLKLPSMLPPLPPILPDKAPQDKSKDKEKKKDKKEKKKKKDKDKEKDREKEKEKERAREREREKEEKKKEKEKREKEKEKEKERHKLEKVKAEPPVPLPSPVIPRLTLRVGAGQDKIVISKVVPGSEVKTPIAKTPVAKTAPAKTPTPKTSMPKTTVTKAPSKSAPPARPRSPPLAPALPPPPAPMPATPLPPLPVTPATAPPLGPIPVIGSFKTPVRSVVTETVSTYVIRDEWGNQIWICPGCNKPDDGSPMIGCDDCDDWYHWPCVGLLAAPPEDVQWFCIKCDSKRKDKKHKKRKHKVH